MDKKDRIDRRVQRTRHLLNHALMSLIVEKEYDSITVQNIIDRANLGRSTFYAHYQDKDDLLMSGLEQVVRRLVGSVEDSPVEVGGMLESRQILDTLPIFRHAQEQYYLHKAIVGGRGIDFLIKTIQNHLSDHLQGKIKMILPEGKSPSVPPIVMANCLAGTLLTLLTWWLDNDMPYPPEQMDEMFQELVMPGFWAVMEIPQV